MKNYLFTLWILFLAVSLQAQDQTLFSNARVTGGFGGFNSGLSLNSDDQISAGGFGGISFENFFFGGFGFGSSSQDAIIVDGEEYDQSLGMGGIFFGGTYPGSKLIHMYGHLKLGWGGVSVQYPRSDFDVYSDNLMALLPEIGLELNITQWFRIAFTGGYQFVTGIETNDFVSNDALRYPVLGVNFRFGAF